MVQRLAWEFFSRAAASSEGGEPFSHQFPARPPLCHESATRLSNVRCNRSAKVLTVESFSACHVPENGFANRPDGVRRSNSTFPIWPLRSVASYNSETALESNFFIASVAHHDTRNGTRTAAEGTTPPTFSRASSKIQSLVSPRELNRVRKNLGL